MYIHGYIYVCERNPPQWVCGVAPHHCPRLFYITFIQTGPEQLIEDTLK